MTRVAVVIPFRDRGLDVNRKANLERVVQQWKSQCTYPIHVVSDGRDAKAQFNRSAAYNIGLLAAGSPDVIIYAESDMLISHEQIQEGVELATDSPGLVVPFTTYKYLSESDSELVREGARDPYFCYPESVMQNGSSIGAINILSRDSLRMIGQWDENFEGNWYDDNAMERAFHICCKSQTRFVPGDAYHLYHLPGWSGDHLSDEDKRATIRNKYRYAKYKNANTSEKILELTTEAHR